MPIFSVPWEPKSTRISRPGVHSSTVTVPRQNPPAGGQENVAPSHAEKCDGGGGGFAKHLAPTYCTIVPAWWCFPSNWHENLPACLPGPEGF
eukprot:6866502-Prymnesium_polylepis.1